MNPLGDISVEQFLKEYWQKRPLLVRNAFPDFKAIMSPQELAGLSLEDEIESRLVVENQTPTNGKNHSHWSLKKGPFDEQVYQQLPKERWTLLVQAVDHWLPEAADFLEYFNFIPTWRRDDLMISYATNGGSVGPHYDQYDVFLIQAEGQREWRLGQPCLETSDRDLVEGSDLKILKHFDEQQRWLLKPGDLLYIPPAIAHWGIAQGECQTYSVGFRAPSVAELLDRIIDDALPGLNESQRFSDTSLTVQNSPAEIQESTIAKIRELLIQQVDDSSKIASMFGHLMTEAKYPEHAPIALTEEDQPALNWNDVISEMKNSSLDGCVTRSEHARFSFYETVPKNNSPEEIYFFYQGEKTTLAIEDKSLADLLGSQRHYEIDELTKLAKSNQAKSLLVKFWASELIYS